MKLAIALLVMLSFISNMFAPFQQEQAYYKTTEYKYWFLGNLTFNNSNRTVSNASFEPGTKNFGEVTISSIYDAYHVEAEINIEPIIGDYPCWVVYITWVAVGENVTGGGDYIYLTIPKIHIYWCIRLSGGLTFHMRGAYEKEFNFGISIVISAYTGFLTVSTNQTTYHIKVRKVNETNATATSTNSWSWAGDSLAYYQTNPSYLQIEQESNDTFNIDISNFIADDGNRTLYTYGEGTGTKSFLKNPSIYTVEKLYRCRRRNR